MEPRGTLNERRWGEVLQIASEVFGERGYPAASLQEIAERLGISPRTLRYKLARLRRAGIDCDELAVVGGSSS